MDKYARVKTLGKGSFGAAILVTSRADPSEKFVVKEVDVSRMPRDEREAARLEAQLLAALHHPNIVTCHESFTDRGKLCIVMDYCERGDLYQLLKAQVRARRLVVVALASLPKKNRYSFVHPAPRFQTSSRTRN